MDPEGLPVDPVEGDFGDGVEVGPDGQPAEVPLSTDENMMIGPDGLPVTSEEREEEDEISQLTEAELDAEDMKTNRVRRFATILNMLNSLLGAGILGIPYSMGSCGLVMAIVILILIAVLSHVGSVMTMSLQQKLDALGLDDLAFRTMGKPGSFVMSLFCLMFCISAMVAYLVIGSDMIMSWLRLAGIDVTDMLYRAILVLIYAMAIPVMLTIPKQVRILSYFSFVTVFSIFLFFFAMISKGITDFPKVGVSETVVMAKFGMGLFQALSVYALTFALPTVVLPIIGPYNPDLKKRNIVSIVTVIISFVLVAVPGIIGYLLKGTDAADNILLSYEDDDILMLIVRIGFFFVVTFSYPALNLAVAASWSQVIFKTNDQKALPCCKRAVVLAVSNAIPVILAMVLPKAGPALSIGGALGGCLIDFFFPPAMWLRVSQKKWTAPENIGCIIFAAFGLITCGICTAQAIMDAIDAFSPSADSV